MLVTRKSKRRPSGGLRHTINRRDKTLAQLANKPILTNIAEKDETRKISRGKSAIKKVKAVSVNKANVVKDGKVVSAKIKTVKQNKANREFARQNTITKGAEILVEVGSQSYIARVTSRPGQDGIINAVIIKEAK